MVTTLADLGHLTPAAARVALLSDEQRIYFARKDRWIHYSAAADLLEKLEELYEWPPNIRMPNGLIIADTNFGKSMVMQAMKKLHPPQPDADGENAKIILMEVPDAPSLASFYATLLKELGVQTRGTSRASQTESLALHVMREAGVRMLMIDELHNIGRTDSKTTRDMLTMLRFLGNQLRIPIVAAGTDAAERLIVSDPQLENRFETFRLPAWELGDDLLDLLSSFAAHFPLRRPSYIDNDEMASRILRRSEGALGEMTLLLTKAAVLAIKEGEEAITPSILNRCNYKSPSLRRSDPRVRSST